MNDTEKPSTIPAAFGDWVKNYGDRPAIAMWDDGVTYSELGDRAGRVARALLALGAGKGTRIGLLAPDGIFWAEMFFGALRIGALVTTVSTLSTPRELGQILRNSDVQILIGVRRFLRHDYAENLKAALGGLDEARAGSLRLTDAPYLRSIWLDDASGLPWAGTHEELLALADAPGAPDKALLAAVEAEVAPCDDAVVIYTSGSTSPQPKAVVHTQRTLACHPPILAGLNLFKGSDRAMPLLPAFWAGGITLALQVLSVGGLLVYPSSPDPETVLDTIQRFDVNRANVWMLAAKYRAAATARGMDVSHIVGLGAEPRDRSGHVIPAEFRAMGFGMSESFAQHSGETADTRLPPDKVGAAGRAVNGVERRILNPETGREVAPGEVGELYLRGGALMSGFYKVERSKVFTADGFYPTKDLARIDADGYAYFVGRNGDMLKTKSANVSRLEVEAALNALPEVDLAIVAGIPDAEHGELVAAAVVPVEGKRPTAEELRTKLRDTLSTFKIPAHITFITHDDVPRTATGKVKLFETGELIAARLGRSPKAA